jgi:hypothetical protein
MKKKVVIGIGIGILVIGVGLAAFIIKGFLGDNRATKDTVVTLYSDSQNIAKSDELEFEGEPTVEDLADLLSEWSGLDYDLNDVKIKDNCAYIDWDDDASLLSDFDELDLNEGFYFDDLESLQWFMLDSLLQTIKLNLGYDEVYFTMNDGEPLMLVMIMLESDEPFLGSEFYEAHSDNVGDLEETSNTYFDQVNQLLLTYPTVFATEGIDDGSGTVNFASYQSNAELTYSVNANTYNDSAMGIYVETEWEEAMLLEEKSAIVAIGKSYDYTTSTSKYYATYTFVSEEHIAMANINCENFEEASYWYDLMLAEEITITDVSSMDFNEMGEEGESFNSYYDKEYQLLLTYPTVYANEGIVDEDGYLTFASLQDNSVIYYYVIPNTYKDTPESFLENTNAEKIEGLGGNNVVGVINSMNQETGEMHTYATCFRVEEDYIAIASIKCESTAEAYRWYDEIFNGNLNIDSVTDLDSENDFLNESEYDFEYDLSYYSYYDDDYDLLIYYLKDFSEEPVLGDYNGNSCVMFPSTYDSTNLFYLVIENIYDHDSESFAESIDAMQIEKLGDNVVIAEQEITYDSEGNSGYYALYSVIYSDYVVVAYIQCFSEETASFWYEMLKENAVYIEKGGSNNGESDDLLVNNSEVNNSNTADGVASLSDEYKIMIDGENMTDKMELSMMDGKLYVELTSYFDAFSVMDHPIFYTQYNEENGITEIYSWATDVVIMYFDPNTNAVYELENDDMEMLYGTKILEEDIIMTFGDHKIMLPLEEMTDCILSRLPYGATIEK